MLFLSFSDDYILVHGLGQDSYNNPETDSEKLPANGNVVHYPLICPFSKISNFWKLTMKYYLSAYVNYMNSSGLPRGHNNTLSRRDSGCEKVKSDETTVRLVNPVGSAQSSSPLFLFAY